MIRFACRFFFFYFVVFNLSLADQIDKDCKEVDLTTSKDSPFAFMHVDQGLSKACYAASLNMLIDYYRYTHGDKGSQTSLLYTALAGSVWNTTPEKLNKSTHVLDRGGIPELAFKNIKKYGLCTKDQIQEGLKDLDSEEQILNVYLILVEMLKSAHKASDLSPELWADTAFDFTRLGARDLGEKNTCLSDLPSVSNKDMENIKSLFMPFIKREDYVGLMKEILKPCKKAQKANLPDLKVDFFDRRSDWLESKKIWELSKQLWDKRQPIGVSYCSRFLKFQNYVGFHFDANGMGNLKDSCAPHASVIAGSRVKNGYCEFLVINTWGKSTGPMVWKENKGNNVNAGHWIGSRELMKNSIEFFSF